MLDQSAIVEAIPSLKKMTYLDSAGAGLPPKNVTNAMLDFINEWSENGERWEVWLRDVIELRKLFAGLIDAKSQNVAVVPSVSVGLSSFASSLKLSKSKVIVSELNFPTNILLWKRMEESGLIKELVTLRQENGRVPLSSWKRAIDNQTGLVALDYVSWLSGYRENVQEIVDIAHSKGSLVVVDGFHALGVFPVSVKKLGVDALVSGFYKWMCGPHGVACLFVNDNVLANTLPSYIGWHGVKDNVIERLLAGRDVFDSQFETAEPSKSAARYEWGTWASVVVRGAIEACRFATQINPEQRFRKIKNLTSKLVEGLKLIRAKILTPEQEDGSGIVTFSTRDHSYVVQELKKSNIHVSGRFGYVRVSPHFYNSYEDIEKLIVELKRINVSV